MSEVAKKILELLEQRPDVIPQVLELALKMAEEAGISVDDLH
jgi:hypothetical protein